MNPKEKICQLITKFKELHGDPHYVAIGMAIGVFIGVTPTIPFHTVIALSLAFIVRGSKAAAAIGVWFSNPFTIPFFYKGSYDLGIFILGNSAPFSTEFESILELLKLGTDVTVAMLTGGIILGILPGIAAYFITLRIFTKLKLRKKSKI